MFPGATLGCNWSLQSVLAPAWVQPIPVPLRDGVLDQSVGPIRHGNLQLYRKETREGTRNNAGCFS